MTAPGDLTELLAGVLADEGWCCDPYGHEDGPPAPGECGDCDRMRGDTARALAAVIEAHVAARVEAAKGEAAREVRARIAALHRPIPIYPGDCESDGEDHAFDPAEEFCRDCPPLYDACETCREDDGSWVEWPCETALEADPNAWVDDLVRAAALSGDRSNGGEGDA